MPSAIPPSPAMVPPTMVELIKMPPDAIASGSPAVKVIRPPRKPPSSTRIDPALVNVSVLDVSN
jgi:hypothetical protein